MPSISSTMWFSRSLQKKHLSEHAGADLVQSSRRSIPNSMFFTQWHVTQQCIPGSSKTKKVTSQIYLYQIHDM